MGKTSFRMGALALALWAGTWGAAVAGEQPVVSWESPGTLSFAEVEDAIAYRVEWASTLDGPWQDFSLYAAHGLDRIAPTGSGTVTAAVPMFYRVVAAVPERRPDFGTMILVTNGAFTMGNLGDPAEGQLWELPPHAVSLDWYWIGQTAVTDAQWQPVYNWALANGYEFDHFGAGKSTNHPVTWMNWYDVVKWCNAASEMINLDPCYVVDGGQTYRRGQRDDVQCLWDRTGFRLPTEAEWENAARAGAATRFPWGDRISHSNANYVVRCEDEVLLDPYDDGPECGFHPDFKEGSFYVSPVDAFAPNAFGLYDVIGNAAEWVWDWASTTYYAESPALNPRGPETGTLRIIRGGHYLMPARAVRLSQRVPNPPGTYSFVNTFRLARTYADPP